VILYLHGFASGSGSTKGRALEARFAARGVPFHRADLTPGEGGFERSTPRTMLAETERLVAAYRPRVLMGSSLGGYLAALAASRVASSGGAGGGHAGASGESEAGAAPGSTSAIGRIVLLAPAFRLFERWRGRLSPADEARWREEGLEVFHHASGRKRRLGWGFMEDAATLPAFPEVRVPTLCLAGRRDEVVPLEDVERFVALTREARLVVLEDGHELVASIDRIFEEAWAFVEPIVSR
jgi:pimeloyl-ACP methyl ester carboxylesterase